MSEAENGGGREHTRARVREREGERGAQGGEQRAKAEAERSKHVLTPPQHHYLTHPTYARTLS